MADLGLPAPQREGRPHVYGPYIDFSCADRYVVTLTVPVTDDGDFAAVTEIGADSGWLLAASG